MRNRPGEEVKGCRGRTSTQSGRARRAGLGPPLPLLPIPSDSHGNRQKGTHFFPLLVRFAQGLHLVGVDLRVADPGVHQGWVGPTGPPRRAVERLDDAEQRAGYDKAWGKGEESTEAGNGTAEHREAARGLKPAPRRKASQTTPFL